MADLTASVTRIVEPGANPRKGKPLPALASTTYYKGMMLAADSNGRAISGGNASANSVVLGLVTREVDNSDGSNDDLDVPYEANLAAWVPHDSLTVANLGARVFATDDDTVAASAGANGSFAGFLLALDSDKGALVWFPGFDLTDTDT